MRPSKGDVVLVTGGQATFMGCLMYVQEPKSWGVQAGMVLPGEGHRTYVRLADGDYELLGSLGDLGPLVDE